MRARNLKPAFFKNEDLAELPFEYRLLFQGLWCLADREGRLQDRPRRIKADVFPYDDVNVVKGISELANKGFLIRYEIDGHKYLEIKNFTRHQSPHIKEATSTIPAPDSPGAKSPERGILNPESGMLNEECGIRTEEEVCSEAASPPSEPVLVEFPVIAGEGKPKTWGLTVSKVAEYQQTYAGVDVLAECRKALQWCRDNPAKRKTAKGMPAFLNRWLERVQNSGVGTRGHPKQSGRDLMSGHRKFASLLEQSNGTGAIQQPDE